MKIIKNKYIPFGKFDCVNLLGLLFIKEEATLTEKVLNHEAIHSAQQYELLIASALLALFASNIYASWWYLLITLAMPIAVYILAWLIEAVLPPYDSAYKDSPFEREAYANQHDPMYLAKRSWFAVFKYILKTRK